jgi:ABC-2 type transport system ATP-binding protein
MIEISHLVKRFGTLTAVDDVSFHVGPGEVLGFLGPNGAGKSTTMKMITGFLTPTSGTVRVCGYDVGLDPISAKEAIGYLPEGAPAYPDMTPLGFLRFIADVRGLKGAAATKAVADAITKADIAGVLDQPIDTLSKGFKRRVGIAQAILHDPRVLIMDEPTDGLDPNQKYEVRRLIQAMAKDKAIIVSTHILEEVEAICTRALIIDRGRVVADGTPEQLLARAPLHRAVIVDVAKEDIARAQTALAAFSVTPRGNGRLVIASNGDFAQASQIANALSSVGIAPHGLTVESGRLDDVFRTLTRPEAGTKAVH